MTERDENWDEEMRVIVKQRSTPAKLDLANLDLDRFPKVYPLTIKQLHLKNNNLTELPGEIFSDLLNLVWLDVRNNKLTTLPSKIAEAPKLKDILLGGNELREIPTQICHVKTLTGLQLYPNKKLISPPADIVSKGFKAIIKYLSKIDPTVDDDEIEEKIKLIEIDDAVSEQSSEYLQSFQNKILPVSLKNPLSLNQYQEMIDKHLKADQKAVHLKEWSELTEEDKLDRSIEKTIIDREIQKEHDKQILSKFRQEQSRDFYEGKPPIAPGTSPTPTDISLIMNHEKNEAEMAKTKKVDFNRGEIGILPQNGKPTAKTDESILDKYLHLENSKKSFI